MPWRNIEIKITRLVLILAGVLIQTSVLAIILPPEKTPNIILLIIIAWTIVAGFEKIWLWAITAGIIADLAFFDPLGKNVILLVLASCVIGFFSNRFPIENRAGEIVAMFFIAASAIIFDVFFNIFFAELREIALKEQWLFLIKNIATQIIIGIAFLYLLYAFFKKVENRLDFLAPSQNRENYEK